VRSDSERSLTAVTVTDDSELAVIPYTTGDERVFAGLDGELAFYDCENGESWISAEDPVTIRNFR
jgi:hypothetical protein